MRHDPLFAAICGKLDPLGEDRRHEQDRGKALAGKSTLNRLETFGVGTPDDYGCKTMRCHGKEMDRFFVDVFMRTHPKVPEKIMREYDLILLLGWNTMDEETYLRLQMCVESGGRLFISVPLLTTNEPRSFLIHGMKPFNLIGDGDHSDLFRVKVTGRGTADLLHTGSRE